MRIKLEQWSHSNKALHLALSTGLGCCGIVSSCVHEKQSKSGTTNAGSNKNTKPGSTNPGTKVNDSQVTETNPEKSGEPDERPPRYICENKNSKTCKTLSQQAFAWWESGELRGANMYQQNENRATDGGPEDKDEENPDYGPRITPEDLKALRCSGANFVQFSMPGIFYVKDPGKKDWYWKNMRNHMVHLVTMAQEQGLFVVLSYRTGPGRGEGDITGDGLNDRSVFDESGAKAKQARWVAMWQRTTKELRKMGLNNVIGYDIMVEPYYKPTNSAYLKEHSLGDSDKSYTEKNHGMIRSIPILSH